MSAVLTRARPIEPAAAAEPRWVIARETARRTLRGAIIWGVVFGLFVLATAAAFAKAYPTVKERLELAHSLEMFSFLLGQPHHAETIAGFTMWRVTTVIAIIGGIWGLLTSTGRLRGEEEAGRWELLLAGRTTRRAAAAQALLGLGGALAGMFLVTALFTLAAGRVPGARFGLGGSLLFSVGLVSGAAMFLAIGALTSQLSATRGQAAMLAAGVLGASFVLRIAADSRAGLGGLRWLSPLGWIEELRPLRDAQPLALLPVVALVLVCAALAVALAERRDLNASILREREGPDREPRGLTGPTSLALRLTRTTALAWLAGAGVWVMLLSGLARSAASLLNSSPAIANTLGRLGIRKATEGYMGMIFLFVMVFLAVLAAGQIAAIRDEEASGRLDNLLVRPVRRLSWLAGRLGVSLALVLVLGLATGFFAWVGVATQHAGVALPKLLEAGLNATIPGVCVLGAGGLVLGLRPRWSAAAAYGLVAWSFLIDLLGALIKNADWLRDSSLFTHVKLAPSVKPDWGTAAVMVLLAAAAFAIGAAAFLKRDLESA
jgi:ABC-2 type transport system permease protein